MKKIRHGTANPGTAIFKTVHEAWKPATSGRGVLLAIGLSVGLDLLLAVGLVAALVFLRGVFSV